MTLELVFGIALTGFFAGAIVGVCGAWIILAAPPDRARFRDVDALARANKNAPPAHERRTGLGTQGNGRPGRPPIYEATRHTQ